MPTYQVTYVQDDVHVEEHRLRDPWTVKAEIQGYGGHLFGEAPAKVERIRRLHADMQPWRATASFDEVRHAERGKGATHGQFGRETRRIASHVVITAVDDANAAAIAPYVPIVLRAIRDKMFDHLAKADGSTVAPCHRIDCVAVRDMGGTPLDDETMKTVVGSDADGSPLVRVGAPYAIAEAFATAIADCDESLHPIRDQEGDEDGLGMLIWADPDGTVWSDPPHGGEALDAIAAFMRATLGEDEIKKPIKINLPPLPRSATLKAATRVRRLAAAIAALEADAALHDHIGAGGIARAQIDKLRRMLPGGPDADVTVTLSATPAAAMPVLEGDRT